MAYEKVCSPMYCMLKMKKYATILSHWLFFCETTTFVPPSGFSKGATCQPSYVCIIIPGSPPKNDITGDSRSRRMRVSSPPR